MESNTQYSLVQQKADEIEKVLQQLGRWENAPLPEERFENMGAFGSNTMTFAQWIQFILLETIRDIIVTKDDFPPESQVGVYAVRAYDADPEAAQLVRLLNELDDLINNKKSRKQNRNQMQRGADVHPKHEEATGPLPLPRELYHLASVLASFEGEALEERLMVFDDFLKTTDAKQREAITQLLFSASEAATPAKKRLRLRKAAMSVSSGGTTRP